MQRDLCPYESSELGASKMAPTAPDYIILTTYPEHTTGNVGDLLITECAKRILEKEKHATEFVTLFRETSLDSYLDTVNKCKAVIMPGFAIRRDMYPRQYRLVDDLDKIKCPLIPVGASWDSFPGDFLNLQTYKMSWDTLHFLKYVSEQTPQLACRDYYTCRVLQRHGIANTVMIGDPAWYDIDSIGKEMKRPQHIERLVFTTPHMKQYAQQAKAIVRMLGEVFPSAEKTCSLHSVPHNTDLELADYAKRNGFVVKVSSHNTGNIEFYSDSDLHVGYRLHGHIAHLRKRIPSILLAEGGRSHGFLYTVGTSGFSASSRALSPSVSGVLALLAPTLPVRGMRFITRKVLGIDPLNVSAAPADMALVDLVRQFIQEELDSGFRRYVGLSRYIDETYFSAMRPFVQSLP